MKEEKEIRDYDINEIFSCDVDKFIGEFQSSL